MTDSCNLDGWNYVGEFDDQRRIALAAPGSFNELVRLVAETATNIRVRAQPGRDSGLTDCMQVVFAFELPEWGDALFNGPWGYRAQYWLSPNQGWAANAFLIAALTSKLLGSLDYSITPELQKIDVCASLRAASAKVWIQEIPSLLVRPSRDLDIRRWVEEAERDVQLAAWGLCAPEVSRFEVKGALLDPYGNEVVPSRKIRRHFDIHHYGFS